MIPTEEFPRYTHAELFGIIEGELVPNKVSSPTTRKPPPKSPEEAGGRNNYFTSRAGQLRRLGYDEPAILAAIRAENESKGYETPDAELITIAGSVVHYAPGDTGDLDDNVRGGIARYGLRIDAAGRLVDAATGRVSRLTTPELVDRIWNDLRKLKGRASAEDIARVLGIAISDTKAAEFQRIRARVLGRPETAEGLEELRRWVVAVSGSADQAVVGGFLQFLWCVKRSLASLPREHDLMPILYNQIQGNGKSTAIRRLVSPLDELVDFINVETLADERKRPDLGRFVVGIWDEMEGADKRDTDQIKNALSSQRISYRPMRTNDNMSVERLMNFIGTSNKPLAAMVRDSSGNRRFVEVETLKRLDQGAINAINYPLLWQAISENAEAPAKAVLGEIRTHQAGGRFQDTVQLWLESDPPEPGEWQTTDRWRTRYMAWCETWGDNPLPVALFVTRLKSEGFVKSRRSLQGERPWGYSAPGDQGAVLGVGQGRTGVGQSETVEATNIMIKCPSVLPKTQVGGELPISPECQKGEDRVGHPDTPQDSGPAAPWPKPPGEGDLVLWVYDIEVFPNRFLFSAFNGSEWVEFDESNIKGMADFVRDSTKVLAGFNNHGYDDVIVGALAADNRLRYPQRIHKLSTRIIEPADQGEKDANFKDRYKGRPWGYSIDVFQLLNAKGSLKEWECRIGFPNVAESPAPFDQPLPDDQVAAVREYCRNDVRATAELLIKNWGLVELRDKLANTFDLGERVHCLSEQGLAQNTFLTLHRLRTGEKSGAVREAASAAPENQGETLPLAGLISNRVVFGTPEFQSTLERLRAGNLVKGDKGGWRLDCLGEKETLRLGGLELSLMVGGLHSVDAPGTFIADADTGIVDLDVTSYYPSLMIGEQIYPSQLGEAFLGDLKDLRAQRVAAKKAGDKVTADALKIVLNATFGKLNDNWSPIRSVSNAFRVTINGQLYLLMLIEALAAKGFEILSANTDGVMVRAPRTLIAGSLEATIAPWQAATGLTLEPVEYAKVYRRDVNNYVAVSEGGKVKLKGAFNPEAGKGDGSVIRRAVVEFLTGGIDPAETIAAETDPTAFMFYQRVKNGGDAYHGETKIGKTVRWYAATDGPAIRRRNPDGRFDTIPNGHRAALALDIRGWTRTGNMANLDTEHYIGAARELISALRATEKGSIRTA